MKHEIIEIDKTSELFPRSLLAIGDDCPEKLYLMGNVELLKAEKKFTMSKILKILKAILSHVGAELAEDGIFHNVRFRRSF